MTIQERMEVRLVQNGLLEDEAIAILDVVIQYTKRVAAPFECWKHSEDQISLQIREQIWHEVRKIALDYCLENPNSMEAIAFIENSTCIKDVNDNLKVYIFKNEITGAITAHCGSKGIVLTEQQAKLFDLTTEIGRQLLFHEIWTKGLVRINF